MVKNRLRLSLLTKIISSLFGVVIVFGFVTVMLVQKWVKETMIDTKKETIELATTQQAEQIQLVIDSARTAAEVVPTLPGIVRYMADENRVAQDPVIIKTLTDFGVGRQALSVYLLDKKGVAVASTDKTYLNNDFSVRNYYRSAIAGASQTEMLIGMVTKQPGVFFSAPIKSADGEILGVSVIKISMQPIYEILIDSYISHLGKFMLVNDDGVIIYTNKEGSLYKSLGQMGQSVKSKIEAENRYLGKSIEPLDYDMAQKSVEGSSANPPIYEFFDEVDSTDEFVKVVRVEGSPFYLVSEVDSRTVTDVINSLVTSVVGTILIILLLGVIIQIVLLRRVLAPLFVLNKYAVKVSEGNFDETVKVKTRDELETLADSVQRMVATIRGFYVGLEEKVKEKTAELEKSLKQIESKNTDLENTKKAVLNVMEDLNEEKDRIFFEKNRIETILKSIGDGVFVTNDKEVIMLMNKAAEKMSGYSAAEGIGKPYTKIFKLAIEGHPEIKYRDFVKEVLETGNQVSLEKHSVLVNRDGTEIPVLDSAAPVKDVEGKTYGCVTVVRDNTRERELERSKDDFLSVTSHQLRTPLGSMRWNLEMLLAGDAGKLNDEAQSIAGQIHEGNLRMIDLVNDLLNVNRIDQGRVLDEPVETDLLEVIKAAAAELDFEANKRKVKVKMELQKIDKVVIDPKRFREVIMNLVSNAVKYNREGGWVKLRLEQTTKQTVITVADNGVGIPKKDMPSMFAKFFRASNAVHSETEGSGLGLYVVKKFVEGWGGKISLESKEGKGTTFTIYLPLKINKLHTDE